MVGHHGQMRYVVTTQRAGIGVGHHRTAGQQRNVRGPEHLREFRGIDRLRQGKRRRLVVHVNRDTARQRIARRADQQCGDQH